MSDLIVEKATESGVWRIRVAGYGTFDFEGTEQQAEEMRAHKANWERGMGMKWRIGDWARLSDRLIQKQANLFDLGKGCPGALMEQIRKAKKAEAA